VRTRVVPGNPWVTPALDHCGSGAVRFSSVIPPLATPASAVYFAHQLTTFRV